MVMWGRCVGRCQVEKDRQSHLGPPNRFLFFSRSFLLRLSLLILLLVTYRVLLSIQNTTGRKITWGDLKVKKCEARLTAELEPLEKNTSYGVLTKIVVDSRR